MTAFVSGQQLARSRDADERAVLLRVAHLVLGIERRHPDEASPSAGHLRHVLDRRRIHPADRQIEIDPAEHFEARRLLARKIREAGGRLVVVLEHDAAHPSRARQLRARRAHRSSAARCRGRVHVDVDGALEHPRGRNRIQRSLPLQRPRSHRGCARHDEGGDAEGGHESSVLDFHIISDLTTLWHHFIFPADPSEA